jgi:hypothetical protein
MGQILALVPLVETKADTKKENQNLLASLNKEKTKKVTKADSAEEPGPTLKEAAAMILNRLDFHGSIDPVREEGPIEDLRNAIQKEVKS